MGAGNLEHFSRFIFDGRGVSISLHQQQCLAIPRQSYFRVIFNAPDGCPIKKLKRAGNDTCRDNGGDGVRRIFHSVVAGEHCATCRWFG